MGTRSSKRNGGNVLTLCLVVTGFAGMTLLACLELGANNRRLAARSQSWNAALPVAEAGLEEALAQLNFMLGANLDANHWARHGQQYTKTRALGNDAYFTALIDASGSSFQLWSTGFVRAPLTGSWLSRTVGGTAGRTNVIFTEAIIASKHVRCGKGTLIDSFDSTDPNHSTHGAYDPAKRKDNAEVAATSSKKNAVKVEKTKVYGLASTAPRGSVEFKDHGAVGDLAWINGGNEGGQPGRIASEFTYDFPEIRAPWTGGAPAPTAGKISGVDYQYILDHGNYQIDGKVELKKPMLVRGIATLYVTDDFKAEKDILIENNARLTLFMGGKRFEVADKNVVAGGGDATQFQYYGLPSNKEVRIKKDGSMLGIIYAPRAKIKIEGRQDFTGSVVGKCVHLKHDGQFHYDEGVVRRPTLQDKFVLVGWVEQ
jgi:hypothetical protein